MEADQVHQIVDKVTSEKVWELLWSRYYGHFIEIYRAYEGPAKSSVTNRLPWFYPRYILKCFTALEWCVE